MISAFDYENTEDSWALAYKWDIILRQTPMEDQ
jgi:protocatechuate 3,4-dioxygenase beta subunit